MRDTARDGFRTHQNSKWYIAVSTAGPLGFRGKRLMEIPDAIVTCGGFGTRMGEFIRPYLCKSAVPILGTPCLEYVLRTLELVGCSRCILCIDRPELYERIERIAASVNLKTLIVQDSGKNPADAVSEMVKHVSSSSFFMMFGHQIVLPSHLKRMIDLGRDFVVTEFPHSSEDTRKVAVVREDGRCMRIRRGSPMDSIADEECYIEVPFLLRAETIKAASGSQLSYAHSTPVARDLRAETILRFAPEVYAIKGQFAPEYQYVRELPEVEEVARAFLREQAFYRDG